MTFCCAAFANGGSNMVIKAGPDGTKWEQLPLNDDIQAAQLETLDFSGSTIFLTGENNPYQQGLAAYLFASQDGGQTWAMTWYMGSFNPVAMVSNNTGLVAAGQLYKSGQIMFTPDGQNWSQVESLSGATYYFNKITALASNGTLFIAAGQCVQQDNTQNSSACLFKGTIADEKSWVFINNLPADTQKVGAAFSTIQWDGAEWIATAALADNSAAVLTSQDSSAWTYTKLPSTMQAVNSFASDGKTWLAAVTNADQTLAVMQSVDQGKTWQLSSLPADVTVTLIKQQNNLWLAAGVNKQNVPVIFTSTDSKVWTSATLPGTQSSPNTLFAWDDIKWNGSNWFAEGTYVPQISACDSLNDPNAPNWNEARNWAGALSGTSSTTLSTGMSADHTVNASLAYQQIHGGYFNFTFSGVCVDQADGSAVVNLTGDEGQYFDLVKKSSSDPHVTITTSCLDGMDPKKPCNNFIGTLDLVDQLSRVNLK